MSLLTREQILNGAKTRRFEDVYVNGEKLYRIRSRTIAETEQWESSWNDNRDNIARSALLWSLCDESGNLIFRPEDEPLLAELDSATILMLFSRIQRMNTLSADEKKESNGSTGATTGDSSSASPLK